MWHTTDVGPAAMLWLRIAGQRARCACCRTMCSMPSVGSPCLLVHWLAATTSQRQAAQAGCHPYLLPRAQPLQANSEGATPLHLAAIQGDRSVVCTLLAASAAPDARDKARRTPLHLAAQHVSGWLGHTVRQGQGS